MPTGPVGEPLKHTLARVRLVRSVVRGEVCCVAAPFASGPRWMPGGTQLTEKADNWLSMEAVRALWTSSHPLYSAVIGRPYKMRLTDEGVRWLRAAPKSMLTEGAGSPTDGRVS